MSFLSVIDVLGGLGLLLLGMKLMTDGLKLAGGGVLRRVLGTWTRTRMRGLLSGFGITALVQSSGAVTIAAIGFVNAGVMALGDAVWVVYGSNVGTTSTAWIVALLGLKVNIKALALPCIAVGTALWLAGGVARRTALGEALAGFGLFFLGIQLLQQTMHGLGNSVSLGALPSEGVLGVLVFMAIGFLLTFAMQSSSAAMALILTATAESLIPLHGAAAAVIGANLGTTTTAAIASLGATPNARRLAAAHVAFNAITGAVALLLLSPMLYIILWGRDALGMGADPASVLALYHSMFNILGILVMWPVTGRMVRFLSERFRSREEERSRPKHLDYTVLRTPSMAIGALVQESMRIGTSASAIAQSALRCKERPCRDLHREKAVLDSLQRAAGEFAARMGREGLAEDSADALPRLVRVGQYYNASAEAAMEADVFRRELEPLEESQLAMHMEQMVQDAEACIEAADCSLPEYTGLALQEARDAFESSYKMLKDAMLEAGAMGRLPVGQMVMRLDYASRIRRVMAQLVKAVITLDAIRRQVG